MIDYALIFAAGAVFGGVALLLLLLVWGAGEAAQWEEGSWNEGGEE